MPNSAPAFASLHSNSTIISDIITFLATPFLVSVTVLTLRGARVGACGSAGIAWTSLDNVPSEQLTSGQRHSDAELWWSWRGAELGWIWNRSSLQPTTDGGVGRARTREVRGPVSSPSAAFVHL